MSRSASNRLHHVVRCVTLVEHSSHSRFGATRAAVGLGCPRVFPVESKPESALLTVDGVAELLSCGSRKARELVLRLPHVRVGKLLRIQRAVLQRWIDRGGDEYTPREGSAAREPRVRARIRAATGAPRACPSTSILRVPVAPRRKKAA